MSEKIVRIEKLYQVKPEVLFAALAKGRLFINCGADESALENDFRVGGSYTLDFGKHGKTSGKYLEIVPSKKLVFTWRGISAPEGEAQCAPPFDTQVTIEIEARGNGSLLKLVHTGFKTDEQVESHTEGWTAGTTDLQKEVH